MPTLQDLMAEKERRAKSEGQVGPSQEQPSLDALLAEKARRQGQGGSYAPRAAGLGARMGVQGAYGLVTGIPALAADAYGGLYNLTSQYITNPALNALQESTGINLQRARPYKPFSASVGMAESGRNLATAIGLPQPETPRERIADVVGTAALSAGGLAGVAGRLPGMAARELSQAPVLGAISAGTGAGASQMVAEGGGTAGQQIAAGLLGGFAPIGAASIPSLTKAGIRGAIRGPDAPAMQRNIAQMESAGVPVSVGTTSPVQRAVYAESALAQTPTGRSTIMAQRAAESKAIQSQIDDMVRQLAPSGTDTIQAGEAMKRGIVSGYIPKAKALSEKLYNRLGTYIPKNKRIDLPNFTSTLKELTETVPGAERTSELLMNPQIRDFASRLSQDLGLDLSKVKSIRPEYGMVSALRSRIGRALGNANLISDIPRAEYKRLYGALLEDIKSGVSNDPAALRELMRANSFTKALHNKVDNILDPIARKNVGEEAFNAVMRNTQEGGSVLKTVFGSLPKEQREILAGSIIDRLGRARPSAQNAAGDVFSTESFLTNWNRLSPLVKEQVQKQFPKSMQRSFNEIAKAAENIRSVNAAMPNPSGTAMANSSFDLITRSSGAFTAAGGLIGGYGLATQSVPIMAAAAAGIGAPYISARMMTNPKFVNWLAQQTKLQPNALSGQITLLNEMFKREDDPELQDDVQRFVSGISGAK